MTSLEAFKKFQVKLDKLDTEDNIDISPGEFVLVFNEWQNKWFEKEYQNRSTRYVDDIQQLVSPDKEIEIVNTKDTFIECALPVNYFDYIRSVSYASKGTCKNRVLYNFEVKLSNVSSYEKDEYNSPSFEFQETFITIADDKLKIYKKDDFSIDSVLLTYYRYPKQVDILGYIKIDGTESINSDPELDDRYVDQIIDLCVTEAQRIYENNNGFQLSKNREDENKG